MGRKPASFPRRISRNRRAMGPGFGAPPRPLPEGLADDAVELFTPDGRLLAVGSPKACAGKDVGTRAAACLGFSTTGEVLVRIDEDGMADMAAVCPLKPGESFPGALHRLAPEICAASFSLREQGKLAACPATGMRSIQFYAADLSKAALYEIGMREGWAVVSREWLAASAASMDSLACDPPAPQPPREEQAPPKRGRPRRLPRKRPGRRPQAAAPAVQEKPEEDNAGLATSLIHGVSRLLARAVAGGAVQLRAVRASR